MKTILIISDSHGNIKGVDELLPRIAENDFVIHLGDGAADMRTARSLYPEKVYACAGNCDFYSPLPLDGELEAEQIKIYYCHGHRYSVKSGLDLLAEEAKRRGCEIALYGHTHEAKISVVDGVTLINPGSMRYSRAYCYLVVNKDKFTPVLVGE